MVNFNKASDSTYLSEAEMQKNKYKKKPNFSNFWLPCVPAADPVQFHN